MFSFIQNRNTFYGIAGALILISFLAIFFLPKQLGIDLTGGLQLEYSCDPARCELDPVRNIVENASKTTTYSGQTVINGSNVYRVSGVNTVVIETGFEQKGGMTDAELDALKTQFREDVTEALSTSQGFTLARNINIGETFGAYIKNSAIFTLILAIVAISIYIQYAFRGSIAHVSSWPFAVVTGASLVHDIIIAVGLYIIISYFFPEYKIDTFALTAILTTLGYSINDTIVVMDRIRSNLHESKKGVNIATTIDNAITSTLTRSLFTSLTILIVLLAMFFFGPSTLHGFMLVLILGTIVGTYSSVCIAAPLLYDIIKSKR